MKKTLLTVSLAAALAGPAPARELTIVACAPGYPGSTREAQPAMDAFAAALTEASGLKDIAAVYHETEAAGLERLKASDAAFALVPLPFFLEHEAALKLSPIAQAVPAGTGATESWTLVAGKGKLPNAAALDGWRLVSLAAYAPAFVKGPALGGWGALPASVKLVHAGTVLSALRKAAAGERIAVLLDGAQGVALPTLPFAKEVEVVYRSPALPVSVFCAVDGHAPAAVQKSVAAALLGLEKRPAAASALAGIRVTRFVAPDKPALEKARKACDAVAGTP